MTATSTQTEHQIRNVTIGRYIDTAPAAGFTITLGYKPRYVKLQNLDSDGAVTVEWYEGMTDDTAWKSDKTGSGSLLTSKGITPSESGFAVGYDTDLCYASEQISWIAFG